MPFFFFCLQGEESIRMIQKVKRLLGERATIESVTGQKDESFNGHRGNCKLHKLHNTHGRKQKIFMLG